MRHDFRFERRAILFGAVLLVAADVALVVYGWNLASGPRPQQDLAVLTRNRDLLRADITRAQDIRQKIPAIQKDCDQFEQSLYPASTGYSSVTAELGAIARMAVSWHHDGHAVDRHSHAVRHLPGHRTSPQLRPSAERAAWGRRWRRRKLRRWRTSVSPAGNFSYGRGQRAADEITPYG